MVRHTGRRCHYSPLYPLDIPVRTRPRLLACASDILPRMCYLYLEDKWEEEKKSLEAILKNRKGRRGSGGRKHPFMSRFMMRTSCNSRRPTWRPPSSSTSWSPGRSRGPTGTTARTLLRTQTPYRPGTGWLPARNNPRRTPDGSTRSRPSRNSVPDDTGWRRWICFLTTQGQNKKHD